MTICLWKGHDSGGVLVGQSREHMELARAQGCALHSLREREACSFAACEEKMHSYYQTFLQMTSQTDERSKKQLFREMSCSLN